jgi:hypothetical protein
MYKQHFVWTDSGVCDITHLWKKRHCDKCGEHSRFLVNVGKKKYRHLMCYEK